MHMLKQLCASLILGAHAFFDCIHYAAYVFLQLAVKKKCYWILCTKACKAEHFNCFRIDDTHGMKDERWTDP